MTNSHTQSGLPFNGLHTRKPCNCMDYYSFTYPGGMEGWVGLVGWPIRTPYPRSGHTSTIDQAQIRESLPAKDRRPNHWAASRMDKADAALTADRAYKRKNIKHRWESHCSLGDSSFKKGQRSKLYCRWQWIPNTDYSITKKIFMNRTNTGERYSLRCIHAWPRVWGCNTILYYTIVCSFVCLFA